MVPSLGLQPLFSVRSALQHSPYGLTVSTFSHCTPSIFSHHMLFPGTFEMVLILVINGLIRASNSTNWFLFLLDFVFQLKWAQVKELCFRHWITYHVSKQVYAHSRQSKNACCMRGSSRQVGLTQVPSRTALGFSRKPEKWMWSQFIWSIPSKIYEDKE